MYGNIKRDINLEVRGPFSAYSLPSFRNDQYVRNIQTMTEKTNGLYNVDNMPVVYSSAGQSAAFQQRQTNAKNLGLTLILHPNRMPYNVKR